MLFYLKSIFFLQNKIKIVSSNDPTIIRDLLLATSDNIIINAIPASLFSNLKIDTTGIPATNIPTAYVNNFIFKMFTYYNNSNFFKLQSLAEQVLRNSCISDITNLEEISNYLSSITADNLICVSDTLMKNTKVNIIFIKKINFI
jgi:hypothetical protein